MIRKLIQTVVLLCMAPFLAAYMAGAVLGSMLESIANIWTSS